MLTGPALAAAETPPAVPDEVALSGRLLVLPRESIPGKPAPEPGRDVLLVTDDGTRVALEGSALDGARSGDRFSGRVSIRDDVRDEIVDHAPPGTQLDDEELAERVVETGSALDETLPVVDAVVQPPTREAVAPKEHSVDIMYLSTSTSGRPSRTAFSKLVTRLSEFWSTQSNGQVTKIVRRTSVRYATVKKSTACTAFSAWNYAAGPSGFNRRGSVRSDPTSYYWDSSRGAHLVVIVPGALCGVGNGLGTIGSPDAGGTTWSSVPTTSTRWDGVVFHEIGHNLGLGHSNVLACAHPRTNAGRMSSCDMLEYDDYYDVMGGGFYSAIGLTNDHHIAALNVSHKAAMDALPRSGSLRRVSTAGGNQQEFRLRPAGAATGLRGLEIVDPANSKRLYVEYRSGTDRDEKSFYTTYSARQGAADPMYAPGVRILRFPCTARTSSCQNPDSYTLKNWTGPETFRLSYAPGDDYVSYTTNSAGSSSVRVTVVSASATGARVFVSFDSRLPALTAPSVAITGTPRYYRTLTATTSAPWPTGTTVRYQWMRDGVVIPGATASTYVVGADDVDALLTVRLIGTAPGKARAVIVSPARRASGEWDPLTVSGTVTFPAGVSTWDRSQAEAVAYAVSEQPPGAPMRVTAPVDPATGAYTLRGVPPGKWRFAAEPGNGEWRDNADRQRDVGTGWHGGSLTREGATVVRVDANRTGIGIAMPRSLHLSGTITLPAGSSASWLQQVRVRATPTAGDPWPRTAETIPRSDGTYTIVGLDRGTYTVEFVPDTFQVPLAPEWYDDVRDAADATPLLLTADRTGVNATLERLRRIVGRVTGVPNASWMQYLTVEAKDESGAVQQASVASDGRFTVDGLMPTKATLCLRVDDRDWSGGPTDHLTTLAPGCLGGGREHVRSDTLDLRAGDATGVTLAAPPSRRISGTVTLPAGVSRGAIAAVSVTAYPLTPGGRIDTEVAPVTGVVGSSGAYEIPQLTPGRYAVEFPATSQWYDPVSGDMADSRLATMWLGATPAITASAAVDVGAASATGRNIAFRRADAGLRATVDVSALTGANGWGTVTLVDRAGTPVAVTSLFDGSFQFTDLVPASYRVHLSVTTSSGSSVYLTEQYLRAPGGVWLHALPAATTTVLDLSARGATSRIRGTVRAVGFEPTTSTLAVARLYERDGDAWVAYPDPLGARRGNGISSFTSPRISAGRYTVAFDPAPDAGAATGEWWERRAGAGSADIIRLTSSTLQEGVHGTVRAEGYAVADPAVAASTPTISGTARVGSKLTAVPGTWTSGVTFSYAWYASGVAISGATGPTHVLTSAQRGTTITVRVTGRKAGYVSVTKTSAATSRVQ